MSNSDSIGDDADVDEQQCGDDHYEYDEYVNFDPDVYAGVYEIGDNQCSIESSQPSDVQYVA